MSPRPTAPLSLRARTLATLLMGAAAVESAPVTSPAIGNHAAPRSARSFDSSCAVLVLVMPLGCTCIDTAEGASMHCTQWVAGTTLDTGLAIRPCASPAAEIVFSVEVNGQPWTHTITAGHSGRVPIPGLYWSVILASLGAILEYDVRGNAAALDVEIAIDACGAVFGAQICMSDIMPGSFPIRLLADTVSFAGCPAPPVLVVAQAPRGYAQISTASQHCADWTENRRGFPNRDGCFAACQSTDGCRAFAWNPTPTGSGQRYCMICPGTELSSIDTEDSWQTFAMGPPPTPPPTRPPTPPPTPPPTRGYAQISTASQHCADWTENRRGFPNRDGCFAACQSTDGCRAFAWNPTPTGSGQRYCMICPGTELSSIDTEDSWQTFAMGPV